MTKKGEPTGLIKKYRKWLDNSRVERKDISKIVKVCMGCSKVQGDNQ